MKNDKKKVAVIGAGIVGVSTAIWLLRKGHDVTLIDREGPAAGTSYGNAGVLAACAVVPVTVPGLLAKAPGLLIRSQSPLFMRWRYLLKLMPWLGKYLRHCNPKDTKYIAHALTAILSDTLQQHLDLAADTPAAEFIKPTEYLFVYDDRSEYEAEAFTWEVRKECGYRWEELDRAQLIEREPCFADGSARFGVCLGDHGFITDPGRYVAALANEFVRLGGTLKIGGMKDIEQRDGRIHSIVLEDETVPCDVGVLTTGIWSEALAKKLGVKIPMEAERGYHIELYDASNLPRRPSMISSGKFVATPMEGRLRCAGIVEFGGLSRIRSKKPLALLRKQLAEAIPGLTYSRVEEWLGFRPAPADSIPLIGEFAILKNMYAGFGHHHVGLTGGPKTGKLLAEIISGESPDTDMVPYDPGRFA
ncbi:MAG: FAD-dependent oxidoreductase [Acidiferrobacterales bacterium]|nr:FAD-dependent oxidoreductase [Acidiferrobacterales bacterium]